METRIYRSHRADYSKDEISGALEIYNEDYFRELKENGFNAIWLKATLRDIVRIRTFPEFGASAVELQSKLNALCDEAQKHDVKVYLEFNEPLAFPKESVFWENYPELKGQPGSSLEDGWLETFALCPSHKIVMEYIYNGMRSLFIKCPKLGGIILQTRSGRHSHCFSHHDKTACPCCRRRDSAEVISEIINMAAAGVYSANPKADVFAWAWNWPKEKKMQIVQLLRDNVAIMADFEKGGTKHIEKKRRDIQENSLSSVGPSREFVEFYKAAESRGFRILAKLQLSASRELFTVSSMPLLPNIYKKVHWLKNNNVCGIMGCWNYGNHFSLNTYAFKRLSEDGLWEKTENEALKEIAKDFFKLRNAKDILKAWELFTEAFDYYPFSLSFLSFSPVSYSLAYPLPNPEQEQEKFPMPDSFHFPVEPYGTDLMESLILKEKHMLFSETQKNHFTLSEACKCLHLLSKTFDEGLKLYIRTLTTSKEEKVKKELKNAKLISHLLQSASHIYKAYDISQMKSFNEKLWLKVAQNEASNLEKALHLLKDEEQTGFDSGSQRWLFTEESVKRNLKDLKEKIRQYS